MPDPKDPGQLLYDQSMCERVHAALQDLVGAGYVPEAPVTLDPPMDDAPPAAGAAAAGAGPAAGAGSSSQAAGGPPPQTPAQAALMAPLRPPPGAPAAGQTEAWVDSKAKAVRLSLSPPDESRLIVGFDPSGRGATSDDFSVGRWVWGEERGGRGCDEVGQLPACL